MHQTLARCRLLVWMPAVLLIWLSTSATAQTPLSSPPISAPGQLVDLGGWRLHLSRHEILISEPDLVVTAIRDVLAATRR